MDIFWCSTHSEKSALKVIFSFLKELMILITLVNNLDKEGKKPTSNHHYFCYPTICTYWYVFPAHQPFSVPMLSPPGKVIPSAIPPQLMDSLAVGTADIS